MKVEIQSRDILPLTLKDFEDFSLRIINLEEQKRVYDTGFLLQKLKKLDKILSLTVVRE